MCRCETSEERSVRVATPRPSFDGFDALCIDLDDRNVGWRCAIQTCVEKIDARIVQRAKRAGESRQQPQAADDREGAAGAASRAGEGGRAGGNAEWRQPPLVSVVTARTTGVVVLLAVSTSEVVVVATVEASGDVAVETTGTVVVVTV